MNILYMHTHDSGRFLSPYGVDTPTDNLLNFAKDSVVFREAFCASPTCSPSRAALLTGTYPHNNGMLGLAHRGFKLNDYNKHLVNYLKKFDYEAVLCGVQHEAALWRNHKLAAETIGYDINLTTDSENMKDEELVFWDIENAKKAVSYIKAVKDKKFFLSFGMFATHRKYPVEIDEAVDERYIALPPLTVDNEGNRKDTAKFYTSAKYADKCIGMIIEALKETGLYEDTLIIFTTDHGMANPFNKCNLLDFGTGVSLILRDPKQKEQGRVIDALVSHVDIFPTICDLLNLEKPDWIQGVSLSELLSGNISKVRDEVFAETNFHTSYEPARSVRTNRYKYIRYYDNYNKINYSNMDDSIPKDFLLENGLLEKEKDMEALYDLYYDPYEKNNLVNDEKCGEVLEDLRKRLLNWQMETDDIILEGDIPIPKEAKVNKKECISPASKNKEDYDQLPD